MRIGNLNNTEITYCFICLNDILCSPHMMSKIPSNTGNHDKGYYDKGKRGYSGKDLITELEKNNVKVLQDETVLIDNRLYLTGRQDRSEKERGTPRAEMDVLVEKLNADIFTVVLDHQPHDYEAQEKSAVDLVLILSRAFFFLFYLYDNILGFTSCLEMKRPV